MAKTYFPYHMHTCYSLLDSVTKPEQYIKRAVEYGMKAICFSEHGNAFQWVSKAQCAHDNGLKYVFGVEAYLTESNLDDSDGKIKDNYHIILLARNEDGRKEINELISKSYQKDHYYFRPRITFQEFMQISNNIITTSACIAGPLSKLSEDNPWYDKLARKIDYYEVQPHPDADAQKFLNRELADLAKKNHKKIILGTDCHSLGKYENECRDILMAYKNQYYPDEDSFDLTFHSYDEVHEMVQRQGILTEDEFNEAIESTLEVQEMCEDTIFDTSTKYPILHGSYEEDNKIFDQVLQTELDNKIADGTIPPDEADQYRKNCKEENRVFEKLNAKGYMLFEYELDKWAAENGIPKGPSRGSVGGSSAAYVLGITDLDAVKYQTIFSRFMNENRVSEPDIDQDFFDTDREKIYNHIIERFGVDKTSFIAAFGTSDTKGTISDIVGGLRNQWDAEHLHVFEIKNLKKQINDLKEDKILSHKKENDIKIAEIKKRISELQDQDKQLANKNPYTPALEKQIKNEFAADEEKARKKYKEIFYYYDGILGTTVSLGEHAAGIVVSPITLFDNYGIVRNTKNDKWLIQLDMNDVHDAHLIKYDILGINTIGIIADTCKMVGIPYMRPQDTNFEDEAVWNDLPKSPYGIFQFESAMAYQYMVKMKPKNMDDLSVLSAALRPTGASYRDNIAERKFHKNPLPEIDNILKNSYGYIVYQEQIIQFLTDICGFSGSDADSIRRAIGKKDHEAIEKAMPKILDGYCKHSPKSRDIATEEAQEFMQIISDSSSYGFNRSHAVAYSMISYMCGYLRYYYPYEFITSYLNHAVKKEDILHGTELANTYKIQVLPPKFGLSRSEYTYNKEKKCIVKGIASVKFCNQQLAEDLYSLYHNTPDIESLSFMDLLRLITSKVAIRTNQLEILIKINFFSQWGDMGKQLYIYQAFQELKCGEIATFKRDAVPQCMADIDYTDDVNDKKKDGTDAKSIKITNIDGILRKVNDHIINTDTPKVTIQELAAWQQDYLGYVSIATGKREDVNTLMVTKLTPLIGRYSSMPWSYRIDAFSIGTGKACTMYCKANIYKLSPIGENDLIVVPKGGVYKDNKGYWQLKKFLKKVA